MRAGTSLVCHWPVPRRRYGDGGGGGSCTHRPAAYEAAELLLLYSALWLVAARFVAACSFWYWDSAALQASQGFSPRP